MYPQAGWRATNTHRRWYREAGWNHPPELPSAHTTQWDVGSRQSGNRNVSNPIMEQYVEQEGLSSAASFPACTSHSILKISQQKSIDPQLSDPGLHETPNLSWQVFWGIGANTLKTSSFAVDATDVSLTPWTLPGHPGITEVLTCLTHVHSGTVERRRATSVRTKTNRFSQPANHCL